MARAAGGTYDDTEGLINLPLTVKEIQAVVFFKQSEGDEYRVSMRSKGDVDIGAVAKEFGGGGHKNAAGCTVHRRASTSLQTHVRREDDGGDRRPAPPRSLTRTATPWTACWSSTSRPARRSHDVVARVRRRARRAPHRPHRHARPDGERRAAARRSAAPRGSRSFLSGDDKAYDAVVRLGVATDTYDAAGTADRRAVRRARWPVARRDRARRSTRSAARFCSSRRRSRRRRSTGTRSYSSPATGASAGRHG